MVYHDIIPHGIAVIRRYHIAIICRQNRRTARCRHINTVMEFLHPQCRVNPIAKFTGYLRIGRRWPFKHSPVIFYPAFLCQFRLFLRHYLFQYGDRFILFLDICFVFRNRGFLRFDIVTYPFNGFFFFINQRIQRSFFVLHARLRLFQICLFLFQLLLVQFD